MTADFQLMSRLDLQGRRVLIREDFNVPMSGGKVSSDARLRAALPTIEAALAQGAAVLLMSHLGRPREGQVDAALSLAPVAAHLSKLLNLPVPLVTDWRRGVALQPGQVALLENLRFNVGETADDEALARAYAGLCEVFVMDAFGSAHRAHASTCGVARYASCACAGPLLVAEVEALERALAAPRRPLLAIVGGAKVSTKLLLLEKLAEKVDHLVLGGGIANTFLAASGRQVGKSLHEPDLVPAARALLEKAAIPLPTDVVTGPELSERAAATHKAAGEVRGDEMILDLGPETLRGIRALVAAAGTILWNGPLGAFEFEPFGAGTEALGRAIAASDAYSLAGGGDTLAAIDKFGIADKVSHISTGGGAFLEFVEGKTLPALEVLAQRATG